MCIYNPIQLFKVGEFQYNLSHFTARTDSNEIELLKCVQWS